VACAVARCGACSGVISTLKDDMISLGCIGYGMLGFDGIREPAAGSARTVPILSYVAESIQQVYEITPWKEAEDYVIFHLDKRGVPIGETFIQNRFEEMLTKIEINAEERKKRNLTFHGLRHSFVTLGRRPGLSDTGCCKIR